MFSFKGMVYIVRSIVICFLLVWWFSSCVVCGKSTRLVFHGIGNLVLIIHVVLWLLVPSTTDQSNCALCVSPRRLCPA